MTDRFGTSNFVVVTTKSQCEKFHWLRKPRLRQEWLNAEHTILRRERSERKAQLMELYYDLIFVAVIATLGHSLRFEATLSVGFFVEYLALFLIWIETVFYLDRFDSDDGLSRVCILLVMTGVVGMGLTGGGAVSDFNVEIGYALSFLWARTAVEFLYLTGFYIPKARPFLAAHLAVYCFTTVFFIGSIFAPTNDIRIGLQVIGFSAGLISPVFFGRIPGTERLSLPLNVEHIVERFSLFSIVIIGETIVSLLFVERGRFTAEEWTAAMLGLFLSFNIQWIFFDIANGTHGLTMDKHALRRGGVAATVWIYSHILTHLSILCLAAGVWNVHEAYSNVDDVLFRVLENATMCVNETTARVSGDTAAIVCGADSFYYARWLLNIGAAGCLLFITINGLAHSRRDVQRHYFTEFWRTVIRVASSVFLCCIALAGDSISPLGYLGIICGIYFINLLVGLEHKKAVAKAVRKLRGSSSSRRSSIIPSNSTVDLLASMDLKLDFKTVVSVQVGEESIINGQIVRY